MAKKKETPPVEETVAAPDAVSTEAETVTETVSEETPQIEAADQTEDSQESASDDTEIEAAPSEDTQPELNESLAPAETAPAAPAERVEVAGGRNYETMFIVQSGEDSKVVTERIRSVVEQDGGAIDNVRISEMRRLAYPIKKQVEGVYVVFNGRFTKETAEELDRALKLDEAVLRHMTLREDQ